MHSSTMGVKGQSLYIDLQVYHYSYMRGQETHVLLNYFYRMFYHCASIIKMKVYMHVTEIESLSDLQFKNQQMVISIPTKTSIVSS